MPKTTETFPDHYAVRQATADDRNAIRAMVRSARINPMGLHWRRFLVAVDQQGRVIGCGQVKIHRRQVYELASIVVQPEMRGQGVAKAIIQRLLANQRSDVWLTCNSSLIPFYERFGFRQVVITAKMPLYFRGAAAVFNPILRLSRTSLRLAVMVKKPGTNAHRDSAIKGDQAR